jgi:hypothetical protein
MPFKEGVKVEDVVRILKPIEPSLEIDEYDGKIEYVSVNESKAKFRPRFYGGRWYLERIIGYEYEDVGDMNVFIDEKSLATFINDLANIESVEGEWEIRAYVWYNGSDEPK